MAAGSPSLTRLVALIAACIVIASLSSEAISANSLICRQLEAELDSASRGGRSSVQLRRQDLAIARQREQLQLAKEQSRNAGCGFSLFGGGVAKCGVINAKVERMGRNLEAMQRKRMKLADGDSGLSRAKVMAALNANGCSDEAVAERRLPRGIDRNSNLLERIFGAGIEPLGAIEDVSGENGVDENEDRTVRRIPKPLDGSWVNDNGRIRFLAPPGQYRTLCVRTCDGYFFPMSNASSPADFDRDQHNCEASCPGTEVQIYYHRTGEESAEMIDFASGAPYSELPAAYLYKQPGTPLPAGCGCNRPKNFEIVSGNPPPSDAVRAEPVNAKPTSGPDAAAGSKPGGDDKKVRVVGPVFLPDPGAAIDLQAPAPTQGP